MNSSTPKRSKRGRPISARGEDSGSENGSESSAPASKRRSTRGTPVKTMTPEQLLSSASLKKATKSKIATGGKRRKVNPPREDSPASRSSAASSTTKASSRRSLPDIDHMTQEQAHRYFLHNSGERAWEHVELHKDMESLVEGNQLSPNSTVFTHDLRDMEVQYTYPEGSRSASRSRDRERGRDASLTPSNEPAKPDTPRGSSSRARRKRTSSGSANRNFVESDVIREHLGSDAEPGAAIGSDVSRWHGADSFSMDIDRSLVEDVGEIARNNANAKRATKNGPSIAPVTTPSSSVGRRRSSRVAGGGSDTFIEGDVVREHLGAAVESEASIGSDVRRWHGADAFEIPETPKRRGGSSSGKSGKSGRSLPPMPVAGAARSSEETLEDQYVAELADNDWVERDVIRRHLGDAPEDVATVSADVRRWNGEEEELLELPAQMRRRKSKGRKKNDRVVMIDTAPSSDSEVSAPRRLRYPFSLVPFALEKSKVAFQAVFLVLKAVLITYPQHVVNTGLLAEVTSTAARAISTVGDLRPSLLVSMVRASQRLASMSPEEKQKFYASFFAALVMVLFALQGLFSTLTSELPLPLRDQVPAPAPTIEMLFSRLSFTPTSLEPANSEPGKRESLALTLTTEMQEALEEEVQEALEDEVPASEEETASYWDAVTTSLRALLSFGGVSNEKAIQGLRERMLGLSVDIQLFWIISARHVLNIQPSKLHGLLLAYPSLLDDGAPLEMLRHINTTATPFTDDAEGRRFWYNMDMSYKGSYVGEPGTEGVDTSDSEAPIFDATYDTRPELFFAADTTDRGEENPVSLFAYIINKLAGEVTRAGLELRTSLVEVDASLGNDSDLASDYTDTASDEELITHIKERVKSLKQYYYQNKALSREIEELEQQWSDLTFRKKWKDSTDNDDNPATNPESWDPVVSQAHVTGLLKDFGDQLRVLMSFKREAPHEKESSAARGTKEIDYESISVMPPPHNTLSPEDESEIMRPDGFYDPDGHWWRLFPMPFDFNGGIPLTHEAVLEAAKKEASSQVEDYLRGQHTERDSLFRKTEIELRQVASKAALASLDVRQRVALTREAALGVITGTPGDDPTQSFVDSSPLEPSEEGGVNLTLEYKTMHPGPKLVDHASIARGAVVVPHTWRSDAKGALGGQAPGHVAGVLLTSPPFVASFWNPFSSPILHANLSWDGVGIDILSPVAKLFSPSTPKDNRSPSGPPTAVASRMRARHNKFGFVSIVKQMVEVLTTGRLDTGKGGTSSSMTEDRLGEDSEGVVAFLAHTLFRGSSTFAACRPWLEAPLFSKGAAAVKAMQLFLGVEPDTTPLTTNVASKDAAPMACAGPGADLSALSWASSGTDQPCSYSISGHQGSVTLVFRESRVLRRLAVQYTIPASHTSSTANSTTTSNTARGGDGEPLQYQCAAPTKIRLIGWQRDPRDSRFGHQDPLDLGTYTIPSRAREVPEQLLSVASEEQQEELLQEDLRSARVLQQHFVPLSITSSVLVEKVTTYAFSDSASQNEYESAVSFFGTFSVNLPNFVRIGGTSGGTSAGNAGAGGKDKLSSPDMRAVTLVVLENDSSETDRLECTSLYRIRLLGPSE